MAFCLPKFSTEKFIEALKDGTIDPQKMIEMTSIQRREFLEKIVGKDDAPEVNALLESKLLLKDQKKGMVAWAKKISGITEATRTDLVAKIERMTTVLKASDEDAFLQDLANKKLGADVSFEEAQSITDKVAEVENLRTKWDVKKSEAALKVNPADKNAGWESEDARLEYGLKYAEFQRYIHDLKNAGKSSLRDAASFTGITGIFKSIQAAYDNSYFLRQGVKLLYSGRNADIWTSGFLKSWADIGRELKKTKSDVEPLDLIKADIYSRPNAMNGKYRAMDLDIGLDTEEAFPSALPEKVPLLGRLYKASETAFNGAAMRFRADLADRVIDKADKFGLNMLDKREASGPGMLVNSMTGRGKIYGFTPGGSRVVNAAFFSIKYLKSNYDTLTGHSLGFGIEKGPARSFVRVEAAKNLAGIVTSIAAINLIANMFYPGSAEPDPRSANFGKIKIGTHTIDTTAGMGALVTLAARLTPTEVNGKWGLWAKTSAGKWEHLNDPKFGEQNGLDVVTSFFEGKASPLLGVFIDVITGRTFSGQKPTVLNETQNLVTPFPVQTITQLKDRNYGLDLGLIIADQLGASVSTTPKK